MSALEDEYAKLWKKISDTTKLNEPMEAECARIEELTTEIEKGHDYVFIGRVGQFCPIKPGCGGGLLCRESVDKKTGEKKYDAAVGTKGYRWLESEMVRTLSKENDIDRSYYDKLVNDAVDTISQYGDFERFVSGDPIPRISPWFKADGVDDIPWVMACGKENCSGCSNLNSDGCKEGYDNSDYLSQIEDEDCLFIRR